MENHHIMLKKHSCATTTTTLSSSSPSSSGAPAPIGMHKNSQMIAKVKPKIRIIHIFAPEIIKTDVENFRELVQRLTGKPSEEEMAKKKASSITTTKKRPRNIDQYHHHHHHHHNPTTASSTRSSSSSSSFSHHHQQQYPMIHKPFPGKLELRSGFLKGEEEIWRTANSGGGFLGGFSELEGFMEQLNHEFPLLHNPTIPLPMEAAAAAAANNHHHHLHHHLDAFGQSQLA